MIVPKPKARLAKTGLDRVLQSFIADNYYSSESVCK